MSGLLDDEDIGETLRNLPEEQVRRILEHLSLVHPEIVSIAVVHVAQKQREEQRYDPQDDNCSAETKKISNVGNHKVSPAEDDFDEGPVGIPPLLKRHTRSTSGGDEGLSRQAALPNIPSTEQARRNIRPDTGEGDLQPVFD